MSETTTSTAVISPCGLYRYILTRTWSAAEKIVWIMLNPSTADASLDDPTIRRCVGFSKQWGAGGIEVYNLFAFRATQPTELRTAADPIGISNDAFLSAIPQDRKIVVAWGGSGPLLNVIRPRSEQVRRILAHRKLECLGYSVKSGQPKHPLYLAAITERRAYA